MEHGRFEYSAIAKRPKWELPGGARVAVWVTPNIEHFHYDKPAMSLTPMTAGLRPDVLNYAWRDYGVRVGVWRLMEVLERQGFVATAALNSEACQRYPAIVAEGNRLKWEWMAHGENNSSLLTGMPEDVERNIIQGVIDTIARGTGKKPRGWLGPALTETDNTLDLLAEAGIDYVADWCNDEQPYTMKTRSGSIVAMPYSARDRRHSSLPATRRLRRGLRAHDRRSVRYALRGRWQATSGAFHRAAPLPCRPSVPRALSGTRACTHPQA